MQTRKSVSIIKRKKEKKMKVNQSIKVDTKNIIF